MFLRKNFDKKTGIYRTSDPIENFKFKVTLKTVHSLIKVPKFDAIDSETTEVNDNNTDEVEERVFQWQQKRFSFAEIEQFKNELNCKTDLQKKYYGIIKDNHLDDENRISEKLFTYTDDDDYYKDLLKIEQLNSSQKTLSIFKESLRKKIETNSNVLNNIDQFEKMYVMANLSEETILFTIFWYDGLILIYPDFNRIQENPYLIEIDSSSRQIYQYSIENVSKMLDSERIKLKELEIISKLTNLSIQSQPLFNIPPKRSALVYLLSEIQSAKNFEYDNIHVRYQITVPGHCSIVDGTTEGSSHTSSKCLSGLSSSSTLSDQLWRFGYCHELTILCSKSYDWDDFLQITYEIISIDHWSQERTEGFTHISIPFRPGIRNEELPCHRDLGSNSIWERLNRYFIGGRRKVNLNAFNGIKSNSIDSSNHHQVRNRYGNHTKSTGYLYVRNQVIVQQNPNSVDINEGKRMDDSHYHHHHHFNHGQLQQQLQWQKQANSIDDVVNAYRKAKERLMEATSV